MKAQSFPEIKSQLVELPGWSLIPDLPAISKTFKFPDFNSGLQFVNAVGKLADDQNHHPDITLTWGIVTVTFWTHFAKGVTELDFKLAAAVNKVKYEEG